MVTIPPQDEGCEGGEGGDEEGGKREVEGEEGGRGHPKGN